MIKKKIVLGICCLGLLNGCVQSTAFLGPVYTLASTGNLAQAGLSYGSGKVVQKISKKTKTESIKSFVDDKISEVKKKRNHEEFLVLVKNNIEKKSNILNLSNQ